MSEIEIFSPLIGTLIGGFVGYLIAIPNKQSNRWKWASFGGLVGVLIGICLWEDRYWLEVLLGSTVFFIGGLVGYFIAALFERSNRWPWAYFLGLVPVLLLNLLIFLMVLVSH